MWLLLFLSLLVLSAKSQEQCEFPWGFAPPRTSACLCSQDESLLESSSDTPPLPPGLNSTGVCDPNEFCFVIEEMSNVCYEIQCDDVSGSWIWFGRPNPEEQSFVVWATVQVTQLNCDADLVVTDLYQNTTTFYGSLYWREIWGIYLFESSEDRDAFGMQNPFSDDQQVLWQDFGNAAPLEQCEYYGAFFPPIYLGMNESTNAFGTLTRDVNQQYQVGDPFELPEDNSCPEGYPRGWDSAEIETTNSTSPGNNVTSSADNETSTTPGESNSANNGSSKASCMSSWFPAFDTLSIAGLLVSSIL